MLNGAIPTISRTKFDHSNPSQLYTSMKEKEIRSNYGEVRQLHPIPRKEDLVSNSITIIIIIFPVLPPYYYNNKEILGIFQEQLIFTTENKNLVTTHKIKSNR